MRLSRIGRLNSPVVVGDHVLTQANVDLPKGTLNSAQQSWTLNTNDQLLHPDAYNDLIVAYRNGRGAQSEGAHTTPA